MSTDTNPEHGAPRPTDRSSGQDPEKDRENNPSGREDREESKGQQNQGPGKIADSDAPPHTEREDDADS